MAIRYDAQTDLLSRSTGLPAFGDFTAMFWLYRIVDQAGDEILWYRAADSGFAGSYMGCYFNNAAGVVTVEYVMAGSGLLNTTTTIALNTWYHIALVFDDAANSLNGFINGVLEAAKSTTAGTATWAYEVLGNISASAMMNGRFAAFKSWDAAFTAGQIQQEMRTYVPVRTTNLHRWTPLLVSTDVRDYSGVSGVAWTAGGTLTTEDGPPIAWSWTPSLIEIPAALAGRTTRNTRSMGLGMQYGLGMGLPAGGRAPL